MATERLHIPIDRFGRVVLPKAIRDRLGVKEEDEFEVEETDDVILLRPVRKKAKIINKNGWLVVSTEGPPITPEMVQETIEKTRRESRWR